MKLLLLCALSVLLIVVSCRETCLHGWDVVATVKEKTLNKALALNSGLLSLVTIPKIVARMRSPPKVCDYL